MTDTQQLRELADDYLNHDLQAAEDYLHAAIAAHNLANHFERLLYRSPTAGEERGTLSENQYRLTTVRSSTMRLFEHIIDRIDRTPGGYEPPRSMDAMTAARQRLDSLKQGKRPILGPTIDDHPLLEPFR